MLRELRGLAFYAIRIATVAGKSIDKHGCGTTLGVDERFRLIIVNDVHKLEAA